jgi:hypothetical protein
MDWLWTVLGLCVVLAAFVALARLLRQTPRNDDDTTHGGGLTGDVTAGGE